MLVIKKNAHTPHKEPTILHSGGEWKEVHKHKKEDM